MAFPSAQIYFSAIPKHYNNLIYPTDNYLTGDKITPSSGFFSGRQTSTDMYVGRIARSSFDSSRYNNYFYNGGITFYYDRNIIDLNNLNVNKVYACSSDTAENWEQLGANKIDVTSIFIITLDKANNTLNLKPASDLTTYQLFENAFNNITGSEQFSAVGFFYPILESGTPTEYHTITQNLTNVSSNINKTSDVDGAVLNFELSTNAGYEFSSVPTYIMGGVTNNFTLDGDKYKATITLTDDLTINASATLKELSITQNLVNVNSDYTGQSVAYGSSITVNLSISAGFNFDAVPTYTMGGNTYNFISSTGGYSATITVTNDVEIFASATAIAKYRLNLSITDCTSNVPAGEYSAGTTLQITLSATGDNYGFKEVPYIVSNGEQYSFTVADDKKTASITFVINGISSVRATAVEGTKATLNLTYCAITPSEIPLIFEGEEINFSIRPVNSNYEFEEEPSILLWYFEGRYTYYGTLQADGSYLFSVFVDATKDLETVVITGRAGLKKVSSKYGLINLYSPTFEELEKVAGSRFVDDVDMGQFIISLRRLYCNIPILGRDVVDLGYYYSNIETSVINSDFVLVDCGTVKIEEKYKNGFDYSPNTNAEIFLPLLGFESIEVNKIMGREITLLYYFNIVVNEVTIIIKAGDEVLYNFECKGGYDIPFIYNAMNNGVLSDVNDISVIFAGFTPFIRLTSKIPYYPLSTDTDAKSVKKYCRVGDVEGYSEFDEIDFNSSGQITSIEIQEIKNLLGSGVILPTK